MQNVRDTRRKIVFRNIVVVVITRGGNYII